MNSKIRKIGVIAMLGICLGSYAQQIDPMAEAVLKSYNEALAENPQDYLTLYDRATHYYEMGDYFRALSDIEMALEYTPTREADYRVAEYTLKADILLSMHENQKALEATLSALNLSPDSQSLLYKAGNLCLINNQPEEALKFFQHLQRENSRSQEAYYGMAKANVILGNHEKAESLLQEVENLGKTSFLTYCRIGDLHNDMGNIAAAARDYIVAYAMTENSDRPQQSLQALAAKNPATVMQALEEVIQQNSENVALNYLMASLAFEVGQYDKAEKACEQLLGQLEEKPAAVYRVLAMSQLFQNKINDAKANIAASELIAPSNIGVLLDKSQIFLSVDPAQSLAAAEKAVNLNPNSEEALMAASKAAILAGNKESALSHLNNVIITNPSNIEALLLRGYVYTDMAKDAKAGVNDFTRAGNINPDGDAEKMVLVALAKSKAGKKLDADGLVNDALKADGANKNLLYLAAVYYAQTSNLEKAKEYADKAVAAGYTNQYNLLTNVSPLLNVAPIRHLMK